MSFNPPDTWKTGNVLNEIFIKYGQEEDWKLGSKIREVFVNVRKKKLIGGRYLVESKDAYFFNNYTAVEDMETGESAVAWGPETLHEKEPDPKRSAEALYLYLDTSQKCKDFLQGKITKVRKSQLGQSFGENRLFDSY